MFAGWVFNVLRIAGHPWVIEILQGRLVAMPRPI